MQFLPSNGRVGTAVRMHYLDANKTAGEEAGRQLHKIRENGFELTKKRSRRFIDSTLMKL